MKQVQVLGPGCPKCAELYRRCQAAVDRLGLDGVELSKVTDINRIVEAGIMLTPGLVVDGEVVSSGKLLSAEELDALFSQ
jgi:small redox-active disulfide protein 2